uniref:signal recognition particle receptor subunit alpha isoform X2 n=1 Tax=Myxine glutinosa TaxID=7769 RepID=UPI00358E185A
MLDFFSIFTKGGIVLFCFQEVNGCFGESINALIKSVILQEKGINNFNHEALKLQYKLDNEFELVFVVGYQKILTLTYVDKFLDDVRKEFRDKYRNELRQGVLALLNGSFNFENDFHHLRKQAEKCSKKQAPIEMKTYAESYKSQKTVNSLIQVPADKTKESKKGKGSKKNGKTINAVPPCNLNAVQPEIPEQKTKNMVNGKAGCDPGQLSAAEITRNCEEFIKKQTGKSPKPKKIKEKKPKGKEPRTWKFQVSAAEAKTLDYSSQIISTNCTDNANSSNVATEEMEPMVGTMRGDLPNVEADSSEEEEEEELANMEEEEVKVTQKSRGRLGGMFSMLRGLVSSKSLTREDMESILEKMKDHLNAKNVAAEISSQLCDSVAVKLEGKVLGTFNTVSSTVKQALQDSLVQILQPKRRVDILRDVMEAQKQRRPFVITFCGVNGVGKSTNLAKICFWLMENDFSVLVAACDTFRAGAVEQLRTHTRRLSALHPPEQHGGRNMVYLYERGYGKDAAGIALEAINFAREQGLDVVLVDTAGRMQDNGPLMAALAKLIAVNMPDLVLFVGEALVGNEAVDQLVKFNKTLADHSQLQKPMLIDGIVLTKFDTIDDKVGAAVSMTYITGQPIVFVGTGQTYHDLRNLNARAIVHALMKA